MILLKRPENASKTIYFKRPDFMDIDPFPWHLDDNNNVLNQDIWHGIISRVVVLTDKYIEVEDAEGVRFVHTSPVKCVKTY